MRTLKHTADHLRVVLLAELNDECRLTAKWFLSEFGFAVDCVRSAEEALDIFDPTVHNLIVTSDFPSGMSGLELAHIIKLRSSSTPVLLYTESPPLDRTCLDLVLQRPTHLLALKEAIDKLLGCGPTANTGTSAPSQSPRRRD